MKPDILECTIVVRGVADHTGDYIAGAAIVLAVFFVALAIVIFHLIDKRNSNRDEEINRLRVENRDLRFDKGAKGSI